MEITKPNQIHLYQLMVLKSALKLEIAGMTKRGSSAYTIAKKKFGFKGNRQKVLDQLCEVIEKQKTENQNT